MTYKFEIAKVGSSRMKKISTYEIIGASNVHDFIAEVNAAIQQGYQLKGDLIVNNFENEEWFYQVAVIYEEDCVSDFLGSPEQPNEEDLEFIHNQLKSRGIDPDWISSISVFSTMALVTYLNSEGINVSLPIGLPIPTIGCAP